MLSVLVPVFNEEEAVLETVREIETALREGLSGEAFEILVIDDGSTDGTRGLLSSCTIPHVRVLQLSRNRGYGAALKAGLRKARFEHLAITDADGTYPNNRLPELFEQYRQRDLDMIVGARTGPRSGISRVRRPPKAFLRWFASYLTKQPIPDLNSGFRIFRRDFALRFYNMYPDGFSFTTTITMAALSNDYQVEFFPISYRIRRGKSKIRPLRDTSSFLLLVIRMTMYFHPLRVFLPISAVCGLAFLVLLARDVFVYANLMERTLMAGMMTGLFFALGLIADSIAKKS